jgi:UDPglucose 6-dehydrogenase
MDPASAEMTKYAANTMLATRISFMNEVSALCDAYGADVELVRNGVGSDSRIGNSFLFPSVGYGGSCFPKDVRALIYMGEQKDTPMTIAKSVQRANHTQTERFAGRVIEFFKNQNKDITLGVWGLAFKAKTDDIRESPAVECVKRFLEAGFKVKAYDPEAMPSADKALNGKTEMTEDSYGMLADCDGLIILTDWQEFRTPDFDTISEKLNKPVIFDGRNLYDPAYVKKQGFEYYSIGRP